MVPMPDMGSPCKPHKIPSIPFVEIKWLFKNIPVIKAVCIDMELHKLFVLSTALQSITPNIKSPIKYIILKVKLPLLNMCKIEKMELDIIIAGMKDMFSFKALYMYPLNKTSSAMENKKPTSTPSKDINHRFLPSFMCPPIATTIAMYKQKRAKDDKNRKISL